MRFCNGENGTGVWQALGRLVHCLPGGTQDPFLVRWTDCEKSTLVGLLLQKRHE